MSGVPKKKATFNLNEDVHQWLKLTAAMQRREMVELLDEALSAYLGWNKMTEIEKQELGLYSVAESDGVGRRPERDFFEVCKSVGFPTHEQTVGAQLLYYLNKQGLMVVDVYSNGYQNIGLLPEGPGCLLNQARQIRLQLTIPGRLRYQQLLARDSWEKQWSAVER